MGCRSVHSASSTLSTKLDNKEVIFYTSTGKIDYKERSTLFTNNKLADGVQTVDIPKHSQSVDVYLGGEVVKTRPRFSSPS
jgi:hypothetical protein